MSGRFSSAAARVRACPAISTPCSSTSTGIVQPHWRMLFASCSICSGLCRRALARYGFSDAIGRRSILSAGHARGCRSADAGGAGFPAGGRGGRFAALRAIVSTFAALAQTSKVRRQLLLRFWCFDSGRRFVSAHAARNSGSSALVNENDASGMT